MAKLSSLEILELIDTARAGNTTTKSDDEYTGRVYLFGYKDKPEDSTIYWSWEATREMSEYWRKNFAETKVIASEIIEVRVKP